MDAASQRITDGIRRRLSDEVGDEPYRRYFESQAQLEAKPGRLEVTAANSFVADLLTRRFADALRRAAGAETSTSPDDISLRIRVDESATDASGSGAPASGGRPGDDTGRSIDAAPSRPGGPDRQGDADAPDRRGPSARGGRRGPIAGKRDHRLDQFVVGASNRLAHGAAVEFSRSRGHTSLSPLFIHSSWGLGKTHLLRGIVGEVSAQQPGARVRYTTGEVFTNEFIAAVRSGSLDGFRRSLRSLDLLCLDDVHFLSNKSKTQEELLHTFDAIASDGAKLVFASDGHPREIAELSDALVSRLMAGMVVRIDPPDETLRLTLVRALAERRGLLLEASAVAI
ncbi:MAG: DnaA/Hda family protein, partial [Planctomycetota bacterium]